MRDFLDEHRPLLVILGVIGCLFGASVGLGWYQSGLQAAMFQRQGIEISRWEVFMGVEPAERVLQMRQSEDRQPER